MIDSFTQFPPTHFIQIWLSILFDVEPLFIGLAVLSQKQK